MLNLESITGILITLHVADDQVLYVMLNADGTINRMGDGTVSNTNLDLFIGKSHGKEFEQHCSHITPQLAQLLGSYTDPHPQGQPCRLIIGFRNAVGSESCSRWQYGTDSQGPPTEICDFVRSAVTVTDPWYEEQLKFHT
jgi:hypothetical protein